MTKKLSLTVEDLEDRIAPSLILPNGKEMFVDDMLHGDLHPGLFTRSDAAAEATFGHGPIFCLSFDEGETVIQLSNVGPWSAHVMSPAIGYGGTVEVDCD
jgi:hypothetical protein